FREGHKRGPTGRRRAAQRGRGPFLAGSQLRRLQRSEGDAQGIEHGQQDSRRDGDSSEVERSLSGRRGLPGVGRNGSPVAPTLRRQYEQGDPAVGAGGERRATESGNEALARTGL